MKNYWQEVKVGDIGEVVGGGTPSTKCSDYYGGDIPWITPKDLSNFRNRYISRGERMISKLGLENSSAKMLPPFSVLFTSRAPIGYIAIAKNELCTNQGFKSIIPDPKKCDALFLYYLLKYKKNDIESIANGSTFQEVSGTALKNFEVSIPPLDEQRKIAGILSALDDKIELNNKINQNLDWEDYFRICRRIYELEKENQNLEAQAQAIFKSWFVDFEPFGGKMPADWNIAELRAVCKTITKGTTPTTLKKAFVDKGVNFIKAESILSNHTIDLSKIMFIDDETNELLSRSQIKPFDILYTIAGTIGRFSMVMPTQIPANTNQAVAIIRCIDEYKFFIYNMFLCGCHTKYLTTKVVQAVQANLSLAAIGSLPIIQPSQDTLEKYLKLITPIFSAIFKNNEESRRLSQLRDTLLPKLMSGEIDVSDMAV